ncbi:MAG: hypothetical protein AAGL08_13860 [Cyanobacteria bacterium J06573_11]
MTISRERFAQFEEELNDGRVDLSDLISKIHIFAMQLELIEPGMWWDFELVGLRLCHPNVTNWMAHYGLESLADFPPGAIAAFASSLKSRLEFLERGLPDAS